MTWDRRRHGLILGLAVALLASCDKPPEGPGIDLFEAFSLGGFLEQGRLVELGRLPTEAVKFDSAFWAPMPLLAGEGWSAPTHRGWEPIGALSTARYLGASTKLRNPLLRLKLHRLWELEGETRVGVSVGGKEIGEIVLSQGADIPNLPVPTDLLADEMHFELSWDPPLPDVPRGSSAHVALAGFQLSEAPAGGVVEVIPAFEADPEAGLLRFAGWGGEFMMPLDVPPNVDALEFDIRCRGGSAPTRFEALDMSGEIRLNELIEDCGRGWSRQRIDFSSLAGLDTVMRFNFEMEGEDARLEMRRPRLALTSAPMSEPDPAPNPLLLDRPDIVMIILDAARGRQFGFAGYERDTTPHIDQLAAESLIFTQAYSECATTSCSVPNMISGVPFLNVGTVFKGRTIPDEVVTMAEYLGPLGYSSYGLSGNPNNSQARNSHQGFDIFQKIFRPYPQSTRAIELIEQQPADKPMYLQLHYLPPHPPLRPTKEFDVYSDPDYVGPVNASMRLRPYSLGRKVLTPKDVTQLIALYDGNLKMADDAIGQVLEALKKAGRWDNTVILVTSDHGEAFEEHDVFSHNSTVYEEMIHVPFVLRLPGGVIPDGVDVDRPVALADIVPTLIRRLGLPPAPEVWGEDLLGDRGPRYLFHRTHEPRNAALGVRSERWKAIVRSDRQEPRLFDMEADPQEQVNLATERPLLLAGLTLRLRDFIGNWEKRVPQSSEDVKLSPEDEAMLRSLGYVE
jgi:arylsulfatase